MIFLTVGHKEFDRLVQNTDNITNELSGEVVMQIGDRPKYFPKNVKYFRFLTHNEIEEYFQKAKLIIAHCSIGPIINARKYARPLIMVPRLFCYREHVDDHQLEFAKLLAKQKNIRGIKLVFDIDELKEIIEETLSSKEEVSFETNKEGERLLNTLNKFIMNL